MITNIDNLTYLFTLKALSFGAVTKNTLYNAYILDSLYNLQIITSNVDFVFKNAFIDNYLALYLNSYYTALIFTNTHLFLLTTKTTTFFNYNFFFFFFLKKFFKLNLFLFIIYFIFFITNIGNYFKQINTVNQLTKLFILNSTEKEVGPVDDYFFFAILFILTISLFIFTAITLILIQSKIFIWAIGAFFLLTFLILTIPVNLFIDFGIVFCTVVKGSASSNNFIKELIFDIISTTTIFIRFVIQNIRFLFIFLGIFELLEWVISNNNNLFLTSNLFSDNVFVSWHSIDNYYSIKNVNYLIINTILFIVLYFYYILHLLFLLLVQITVYLGISIWLFFFLYSTKFLNKLDKLFLLKKLN